MPETYYNHLVTWALNAHPDTSAEVVATIYTYVMRHEINVDDHDNTWADWLRLAS